MIGLTSEDFKNILITSAGELPALFVALAGMELLGRRSTIAIALVGCAAATALLTTDPTGGSFTALMFMGRLLISVAFNTLMVYTKVRRELMAEDGGRRGREGRGGEGSQWRGRERYATTSSGKGQPPSNRQYGLNSEEAAMRTTLELRRPSLSLTFTA